MSDVQTRNPKRQEQDREREGSINKLNDPRAQKDKNSLRKEEGTELRPIVRPTVRPTVR